MSDELDDRVRSLTAERQRPERVVEIPDLLDSLIRSLHRLFLTPPDPPSPVDNSVDGASTVNHLRAQQGAA